MADEIAASKHTCCKNYARRVAIQLKIYGVKSYIGLMRREEDKLLELKQKAPELVDDSIFEYSQREAERIVGTYERGLQSYVLLGSIKLSAIDGVTKVIKNKVTVLKDTVSGKRDSARFEDLL